MRDHHALAGTSITHHSKSLCSSLSALPSMNTQIDKKRMQAAGMVSRVKNEVEIHSRLKHPSILEVRHTYIPLSDSLDNNIIVLLHLPPPPPSNSCITTSRMTTMCTWCWKCARMGNLTDTSKPHRKDLLRMKVHILPLEISFLPLFPGSFCLQS